MEKLSFLFLCLLASILVVSDAIASLLPFSLLHAFLFNLVILLVVERQRTFRSSSSQVVKLLEDVHSSDEEIEEEYSESSYSLQLQASPRATRDDPLNGIEQTTFMFNLEEDIVRTQIMSRLYRSCVTTYSILKLLCSLRLVCRSWKRWIDECNEWKEVRVLYQEELATLDYQMYQEEMAGEDSESD
jgi:hypothetical protein